METSRLHSPLVLIAKNLVWSDSGKTVLLRGLDNLIIVDSADGLLVADKNAAEESRVSRPSRFKIFLG